MNLGNSIELKCPKCAKHKEVERDEFDYPEAVRLELACPECNAGDFAEPMYYDKDGKHITRDPSVKAN